MPSPADIKGLFFCQMPEHNAAIQHEVDRLAQDIDKLIFRIKHSVLMPDHVSLNSINKISLCAELCLRSTDHRFSEAAVTLDSVITVKCHSLATPAVQMCCALKRSLNAA